VDKKHKKEKMIMIEKIYCVNQKRKFTVELQAGTIRM